MVFAYNPLGTLTDIRMNSGNKLSGYIRIINYLFIIRLSINMAAHSFHVLFV